MSIVHHCKMQELCMNEHKRSSRDKCKEGVSNRCKNFVSPLIANFTQYEDPPLITQILECASTYEPPCKDDKGFQWNEALEHGTRVKARKVMRGGHGLCHKEPFIKLVALFVTEYVLLHHPMHFEYLLHCCKLDHVSKHSKCMVPWAANSLRAETSWFHFNVPLLDWISVSPTP